MLFVLALNRHLAAPSTKVECRTLIIHGIADEVVPFWNGEALHKSLTDPHEPLWIPGKGIWVGGWVVGGWVGG